MLPATAWVGLSGMGIALWRLKSRKRMLEWVTAAEADSRGAEFVNLFYGSDVSEEDAQKAGEQFGRLCPGAEINVVSGGQPVYYYIISME